MTTKAQRRAQARYDATRDKAVNSRYSDEELAALDAGRRAGESRAAAQKRLVLLGLGFAQPALNVREMLKEYLGSHGFAGLCADDCGCGLDDFAPCGEGPFPDCVAARCAVVPPDGEVRINGELLHHEMQPGDLIYYQVRQR